MSSLSHLQSLFSQTSSSHSCSPSDVGLDQSHVFRFYSTLSADQQVSLMAQATALLPHLPSLHHALRSALKAEAEAEQLRSPAASLSPFLNLDVLQQVSPEQRQQWYSSGLKAIAHCSVAAVLLAGGQGTRLGSSAPKGCFKIGLLSGKSLFQLQAERIMRLKTLAARESGTEWTNVRLPWFVMTSAATHDATVAFFAENGCFGLDEADVHFFQQPELPALSFEGKILMESTSKICLAPNGNGGVFQALETSGSLQKMREQGIQHIHVYGVDNALVRVADPTLIGYAIHHSSRCVNKVVLKRNAHEKVGVMALKHGVPHVLEYTEIPKQLAEAVDEQGRLLYSAGNIVQQYFSLEFLETVKMHALPYHIARKAIAVIDETGQILRPTQPNAIKLEMFNFDIFARDPAMRALAVERSSEFTAVKNANSARVDCPDTARQDLSLLHRLWIEQAGGTVNEDGLVEVSPLVSYSGEDLEVRVKNNTFTPPFELF